MTKPDRRVQRTRELLQKALIELMGERGYEAITIQDIVDRGNVGRTTFYLHYHSKDQLFVSCHEAIVSKFRLTLFVSQSRKELLGSDAPPEMVSAFQHLENARAFLYSIFLGKENQPLLWQMRERSAQEIEAGLRATFDQADSTISLTVLASYLAGAQFALVQWWLKMRQPCTPEDLALTLHRLQRAAIRDAFGLIDQK